MLKWTQNQDQQEEITFETENSKNHKGKMIKEIEIKERKEAFVC